MKKEYVIVSFVMFGLIACYALSKDELTSLLKNEKKSFLGYTLFSPINQTATYLINNRGEVIHVWECEYRPGQSVYLLDNGHLLKTICVENPDFPAGGAGGGVQEMTWEGEIVWDFRYSSDRYCQHHDIERLPNGNVLMIAWETVTREEAIAAGRNPTLLGEQGLWVDQIIEVKPTGRTTGEVVWEWHVMDHLIQDFSRSKANYGDVRRHPERIDFNFAEWTKRLPKLELDKLRSLGYIQSPRGHDPRASHPDWTHINSIAYNADLDQIMLSVLGFNEIWIIDHSTTTKEAAGQEGGRAGKGGDILFRWGNPQSYRRGSREDQKFFLQHDAVWIPPGFPGERNILVFNNGTGRSDGNYSSVEEIVPPLDKKGNYRLKRGSAFKPDEPLWVYTAENRADFFSTNISGAQRLPNGNTLICSGAQGRFFEVTPDKEIVWEYINPFKGKVSQLTIKKNSSFPLDRKPLSKQRAIRGLLATSFPPQQNIEDNNVFRCYRYSPEYSAFNGKNLEQEKK